MSERLSTPLLCRLMRPLLLLLSVVASLSLSAQTDIQLTQYTEVPSLYNPAATGTTDYLRIRGGARLQWIGIHNAPKSFLAVAESPLQIGKKRIGLGANLQTESLGLFSNTGVNLQASYKLKLLGGTLSIGVQGGYMNQKFEGSKVEIPDGDDYHQSTDEAIPQQDVTGNVFDLSAGVHFDHPKFYVGVSVLHALDPTIKMSVEGSESSEAAQYESAMPRMFYFTAGSNIDIKNTLFDIQPSLLVKSDLKSFTAEVTLQARYNKFLRFGLGYRWKDAVSILIGAEIKNFFLGYAYDYPLSAIAKASSGSHELIAGYQLKLDFSGKNKNKHRSIRFM